MSENSKYKLLGEKVIFNTQYKRVSSYKQRSEKSEYKGHYKEWTEVDSKFKQGIVVGYRTISNGFVDYDDAATFDKKEHLQAVLVSFSLYRKPVLVPVNSIIPVIEEDNKIIDANDPKYLLGLLRNIERRMPRTHRKSTSNVAIVRDYLMCHTSKGGRTSSYEMCEYIGIDGDAFTFY